MQRNSPSEMSGHACPKSHKILCPCPSLLRTRTRTRTHVRSRVRVRSSLVWLFSEDLWPWSVDQLWSWDLCFRYFITYIYRRFTLLNHNKLLNFTFFISMIASDECSLWNRGFIRTNICWGWGANGVSTDGVSELSHRTINSWLNESPSQIRFVGQWEAEVQTLAVDWSRFGLFKPFDTDKNQFGTMSVKLRYLWLHAIMHKPTHACYMVLKS